MDILQTLVDANSEESRLKAAKEAKARGQKVIGYLCCYVPQEIIYAAGMFPLRIMGNWRPDMMQADGYMTANSCSFCRSCLQSALNKEYDFLDGIVTVTSCGNMNRLFDTWEYLDITPFSHMLDLPGRTNEDACEFYVAGVRDFKAKLENHFELKISAEALSETIEFYNKTRILQKEFYDLRLVDAPPVTGAEALGVITASMVIDRKEYNDLLEKLIAELKTGDRAFKAGARILVSGSILSDPEGMKLIEDQGGIVVADDLCTGSRFFWETIDSSLEPLEALGKRYLDRVPCARMFDQEKRLEFVLDLVKQYRVDGVIYSPLIYCDPWSLSAPLSLLSLKEAGIPYLQMEREYGLSSPGQLKTRVGAFLEMLTGASEITAAL